METEWETEGYRRIMLPMKIENHTGVDLGQPIDFFKNPHNRGNSTIKQRKTFNYRMATYSDPPETASANIGKMKKALHKS